jgi:uncharacterized protein YqeY
MALKEQLQSDLTTAMKAQDKVTLDTIRMVLTAITNAEVAGTSARALTEDDVIGVLSSEAKRRREAAEVYSDAGEQERAAAERAELTVIERYLPAALTDDEVRALVEAAVAEAAAAGVTGPKAMGAVMKIIQPQVRGRADGAQVAALVKEALA